jgi:hypothetical protein
MEFQKRLYFAQEDVILAQRRKEAGEESGRVDGRTKEEILSKWKDIKIEKIPTENRTSQDKGSRSKSRSKERDPKSEDSKGVRVE